MTPATEERMTAARDDLETVAEIVDNPRLTHMVAFHAHPRRLSGHFLPSVGAHPRRLSGYFLPSLRAQQCIEKSFKAVLEAHNREVPNIHNLITLHGRVDEYLPYEEEVDVDVLDRLNQLYIDARYPGERGLLPEGKPTEEDARRLFAFAEDVFGIVRRRVQERE